MRRIDYRQIFGLARASAVVGGWLLVCFCGVFGQEEKPAQTFKFQESQSLQKNERVERRLKKGEADTYTFSLKRGELVHIVIEQYGINVVEAIAKNDGERKPLKQSDQAPAGNGAEHFVFMAESDGEYVLGIFGFDDGGAPDSRYILQNDAPFSNAEEKESAADELDNSGSAAYQKQDYNLAILYHEHALSLLKDLPETQETASVLFNLGSDYYALGSDYSISEKTSEANESYRKAIEFYEKTIPIYIRVGTAGGAGISFYNIGLAQQNLGRYVESIKTYQKALPLLTAPDNAATAALALKNIGDNYAALNDYEESTNSLEESLTAFQNLKDSVNESFVLFAIANNYYSRTDYEKSLEYYLRALPIFRKANDRNSQAAVLANIGLNYASLEKQDTAFDYLNQSLVLARLLGNDIAEASVYTTIGQAYLETGRSGLALKQFEQALASSRRAHNSALEIAGLRGVGLSYSELGNYDTALKYHEEALKIADRLQNETEQSLQYGNIGLAYMELGRYEKAFEYDLKSLEIDRRLKDRYGEQTMLNNLAVAYLRLGSLKKAEEYMLNSMKISQELKIKRKIATSLSNLGTVYARLKQYDKAAAYFEQSLPMLKEQRNMRFQVTTNYYHGTMRREMGELEKAVELHTEAIKIAREAHTPKFEARSQIELGLDLLAQNKTDQALTNFQAALTVAREVKAREEEAAALDGLMQCYQRLKRNSLAIFYGKQSINIVQSIRGEIVKFDKDVQSNYLNDNQQTYRTLVDLLIAEGRIAEAEQVLRMLKEEEFYAYLRRDDSVAKDLLGKLSLTPDETAAFKRYGEFADATTAAGKELGELQKESLEYEAGKYPKQARLDELEKQIADANQVFNRFLEELNVKFKNQTTGQTDARVEVVSNTQSLLKELNEPHTVIISTIAGEDKLSLLVTTADAQRAHTVEINAADLNKLILDFREAVKNPEVDPRVYGKKLYDVLFPAELQKDLDGVKADTIIWSLDGTLRYAPLAALWDGKNYLAERYANAVITLASRDKLAIQPTNRKNWTALGVGVSKPFENFSALAAVPEELCSVINDAQSKAYCDALKKPDETGVLTGKILPDEKFSLADFKANLGRYKIIHIASHFSLNAGNESDSFLLLGEGKTPDERKLSLATVRDQFAAKFVGVELLTLSACNTAMSAGNKSNGLEVEGFGALAQRQGAKSVMATLWAVADPSTRDLMSGFYKNLEDNPEISKAEALRKAQMNLLLGKNKPLTESELTRRSEAVRFGASAKNLPKFVKDENAPFAHPFYWSPFVLIGNWR